MWNGRVVQGHDERKHELKLTGTEHMVIIVTFGDGSMWLTDVGFGGQVARRPLRIDQIDLDPPQDCRTYGIFLTLLDLVLSFLSQQNTSLCVVKLGCLTAVLCSCPSSLAAVC